MAKPSTWLITGASSGLGKAFSQEALNAGHKVIGTSRDVARAKAEWPEFATKGGLWVQIDPAHETSFDLFSICSAEHDVDILVCNAGYAHIGGIEDTSEEEARKQMEVNFYGPLRAVRACLPVMRQKRRGEIVLISSGAGFIARPVRGYYSASKFAIEAIHESLSYEVKNLGIKVLIVEPGAFRTPFSARVVMPKGQQGGFSDGYQGTAVEQMMTMPKEASGTTPPDWMKGDPQKAARAVVAAVDGGHEYLRLPLGPDCVKALEDKIAELQADLDATRTIAVSTDAD